eukprot:jgi/Orpsp1_1/1190719/evm.model.d7180000080749.1
MDEWLHIYELVSGNSIFNILWDGLITQNHTVSVLPGKYSGISGSTISGMNIGINRFISDERIKASVEVLKYINSKEVQKQIIKDYYLYSGITSLYDDEEVCGIIDCDIVKNFQGINRPIFEFDSYDDYVTKVLKIFNEFLFEGISTKETLSRLDDITKIYFFSPFEETVPLIMFILLCCVLLWTFISLLLLLFIPVIANHFNFYCLDLWVVYLIGMILVIISEFTLFQKQTVQLCYQHDSLLIIGYTIVFLPLFCKLIINFPKRNKFSGWLKNNRILFISCIIIFLEIFNLLKLIKSYTIKKIESDHDKKFEKCQMNAFGL